MRGKSGTRKDSGIKAREAGGILLLAFSAFCLLSLYVDTTGRVGIPLRSGMRMCIGDLAVLFVLIFAAAAVQLFLDSERALTWQSQAGLLLLVGAVTLMFHKLYVQGGQFTPSLREEIDYRLKG